MPEYLTEADLVQQPQSDFLTEADLVAPVKVGKKVVKKKVVKPSVGALREQAAGAKASADTGVLEGHDWDVEGGQPQIQLQVKPSTSLDFRSPEVSVTTTTPKLKLTPTRAKRREGESFDEFNIRASQFESAKRQQETQAKAERAVVRSKVAPDQGLAKYPIAAAQGVGNVLAPLIRQGGKVAGIGPEETWDQQMPVLNQEEAGQWSTKVAEGLGSTIPFALTSMLTGTAGTALLGASSNAAQTYEEALSNGVSHDQALQAAIPGAIIGSLEGLMGLGTGKFVEQMGKGTIKSLALGIGEEEFQELTSQVLNNVNAKMLSGYDPNRAISEGMWDTFVTTLGTAGLAHGATLVGGGHPNLDPVAVEKARTAWQSLPMQERVTAQFAQADPDPKSFNSLTPKQRQAALLNWSLESDPRLKQEDGSPKPVYHGTQSPNVIEEIDLSKSDPDGLYGPGFYTTQDPEVAAGEGGYAATKSPNIEHLSLKEKFDLAKQHPEWDARVASYQNLDEDLDAEHLAFIDMEAEDIIGSALAKPHAYKLFLNIKKPFDIEAAPDPEFLSAIDSLGLDRPEDPSSNDELYKHLIKEFGNKADLNEWLQSLGYDGITHLGGGRWGGSGKAGIFTDQAAAHKIANEIGGTIEAYRAGQLDLSGDTKDHLTEAGIDWKSFEKSLQSELDSTGSDSSAIIDWILKDAISKGVPKSVVDRIKTEEIHKKDNYQVMGHRVWIAFDPAQVKSVWAKEFDPGSTKLEMAETHQTPKGQGEAESRLKFAQPAARFYEGSGNQGGTVYINPKMAQKIFGDEAGYSTAGAVNIETKDFGRSLAKLDKNDPQTKALEEAFVEAVRKGQPSVNVVNYSEGQGMWARRLVRHEAFHRGQYLAAQAALRETGREHLFQPDIGTIHDPSMHEHPIVKRLADSPIGESIKSRYEGYYAPAALTFEAAAYMASNDYRRFGVTAEEAANFIGDYLESVANRSGDKGLQALIEGTRLNPSVEQKAKEILNARQQAGITGRGSSSNISVANGGNVAQFAEPGLGEGGDQGKGGGGDAGVAEPEHPNLYVNVLSSDVVKDISKRAGEVLKQLGIAENPLLPPHEQIAKILSENPDAAIPVKIGEAMRAVGMDGSDLAKAVDESSAHAGKLLQALQQADAHWSRIIKEHPEWSVEAAKQGLHAFGMGPKPEKVLQEGIKGLKASALGRTMWERSGDLYRKMLLTRFSTAANNALSTLPRIPLDLLDGLMTGAAMGAIDPKKWAGTDTATRAEGAKAGALAGMQASLRVATAFPEAAKRILRMGETPSHNFNEMVIAQMEQLHPDLHSKLEGKASGIEDIKETKVRIDKLKELLPYLNDASKQKEYEAELNMYQKRYDTNHTVLGKLFNKTNWMYDQFLKPGNIQEFFFRRPYFVGALAKRAAAAGFDLNQLAQNAATLRDFANNPAGKDAVAITQLPTLADLPPEVWEAAADDALTFTYAYAPKTDRGVVENLFATWAQSMNKLGLAGALIDAFPKATYNGLKFAYEYSPLGMIKPGMNAIRDAGEGAKNIQYDDASRLAKATLGTAMFATALALRKEAGGEEWWQIKTGKKDKKGQPIYLNAKKYMPFSGFLYLADVAMRFGKRDVDKKYGDELAELYLNSRRTDNAGAAFFDAAKELYDYWDTGASMKDKTKAAIGKPFANIFAAPLTPLVNLRDLVAQFDEDEAAKRDMKSSPLLGPSIDRIPWLRSSEKYGLPLYQPPTEPAPQPSSAAPALTELGISLDPGTNFATREFARLGISPIRWLKPDPDPKINRAQYAAYAKRLALIAPKIEASPLYQSKTDAQKAAFWEAKLSGPDGLAAEAKELGQQANPQEVNRREILKSQPPLQRKASGLDKKVQEMKNKTVP